MGVGVDDVLVDEPGDLQWCVLIAFVPEPVQAPMLSVGQEPGSGQEGLTVAVEGVTGTAAVPVDLLLEALPAGGELLSCELNDVEGVHHRGGLGQRLGSRGVVASEPVHGHDLDPVPESRVSFLEPVLEHAG